MTVIARLDELASGEMKRVDLQGTFVGVANVDGVFYAFSDLCPHAGCVLTEGRLEGSVLICGKDGSRFDLASGKPLAGPATRRIRTYRVQVDGTDLRI